MKVRLISRELSTGVFIISQLVELEELEGLVSRVKTNAAQAIGEGLLDIVPGEGSLARLFPDGEAGIVVAMYLSQDELRAKRAGNGLAALLGGKGPPKSKRKRWR